MRITTWIIGVALAVSTMACLSDKEYSQEEVEALMQSELERRIRRFRETRSERCYEQMLQEAVRQADSIMVVRAREAVPDPGRPDRPDRPVRRTARDTLPVKPLFERDSLLGDTATQVDPDSTGS